MRRMIGAMTVAAAVAGFGAQAQAADALTLQLKWVTQAQFAGYYVAREKGFYDEAGLDVTIKAGGPDINPSQVIAGGGADVVLDWMPSALATREKGVPLVNIAQPFQKSGMMLTCRNDSGVTSPDKFADKTVLVEGNVRQACTRKGCWMELSEGPGAAAPGCRVTFKDYGFFVPTDSAGAKATVEGSVKVKVPRKTWWDLWDEEPKK